MKKLSLILLLLLGSWCFSQQQNVKFQIEPTLFSEADEITITVSDINPSAWGFSDIYLWSWSYDLNDENSQDSPTNGSWQNSDESQKLTNNGDGTYSFTMTASTIYARTGVGRIGMLIKAKNGDGEKKTQDNYSEVGTFQVSLTSPSQELKILNAGDNLSINASISINSDVVLKANGVQIDAQTSITNYAFNYIVNENTSFVLDATHSGNTISKPFQAIITPIITEAPVPTGLKDGINLDSNNSTKATLVLYAPGKEFVHVKGDFNNWQIDNNYLMKKDSDKDRFWIEISGLTPQTNHLYQYLIEYNISIADPYSTLILDGYGNDVFISEDTYPNIPEYPLGQSEAITVLRTGDPEYIWQTTNFQPPAKTDLVIYELLIRDFDALHSFNAVKDRLDYIQNLGINAIELMPINEYDGNESWGYNPSFHMALDKYYGTKDALKAFIDECHARGISVIIDVVYNHATGQHPYYRLWNTDNGGTGGQASADNPFFNPVATHSYSVFNDFNHQSEATKDYVKQTVTYWINEFKIDGMRWDLTKGFTQNCSDSDENCTNNTQTDRISVLQEYADTQWTANNDFFVIFEHLGGIQEEEQWANYRIDEDKGIMLWNKQTEQYNEATLGFHENNKSNFSGVSYINKGFSQPSAISYMESHDEERLMFKNIEFGNSEGSYNVKSLATALSRQETAGAFFFSIPGPKMIWQFGELGYDTSIDFNGRVGNKPIKWEYAEEDNRKAIYNIWSKLILLKQNEPIFKTSNFNLDLGNSNGLKQIKLTLESAASDTIKYVTVIGNFGVTEQEIIPNFQETGVWYEFLNGNLKYIVTSLEEPIILQPGEFRIFGNNPTDLFLNDNIPDDDSDGVVNIDDTCPNTSLGSPVDVNGCEVFSLPTNNFSVKTQSETCSSTNNGSITITAIENYTYTAILTGTRETIKSFNSDITFTNLSAGKYSVCITLEEQPDYEQCYDITVSEPENLLVTSSINLNTNKITLTLKGAENYFVTLNEQIYSTSKDEIILDLNAVTNILNVKTDKTCQGEHKDVIILENTLLLHPNPIKNNTLFIELGQTNDPIVQVDMHTITGALISSKKYDVIANRIQIDIPNIKKGMYIVKIKTKKQTLCYKIVK